MRYPIRATLPGLMPFAVVLFLSSFCSAQQVTIRVVNSGDGQPLPGWKVEVFFVSQTQGKGAIEGALHLQTDADGAVQFTLPQSVPDVLTVYAFPQLEKQEGKWYGSTVKAETAVVVQKGIQSKGITAHAKVGANPGQILILAKRVTLWDRTWRTILGPLVRG
jgi:hypothetical protein